MLDFAGTAGWAQSHREEPVTTTRPADFESLDARGAQVIFSSVACVAGTSSPKWMRISFAANDLVTATSLSCLFENYNLYGWGGGGVILSAYLYTFTQAHNSKFIYTILRLATVSFDYTSKLNYSDFSFSGRRPDDTDCLLAFLHSIGN